MSFELDKFYSQLVRGQLRSAIGYLRQFPEEKSRYEKYLRRFEVNEPLRAVGEDFPDSIMRVYQQYYRDVFYLGEDTECAEGRLWAGLAEFFGPGSSEELETAAKQAFAERGYEFQGGRTGGYYGPYIWNNTEKVQFEVELPEGREIYSVRFLDGFISKSWLDYLSFGEVSTGGWANGDGLINCVKTSYDTASEDFRVSLLKHEAQHELDLRRYKGISSAELEYRAKLVELIYSQERDMLSRFVLEAADDEENAHGRAAAGITARIPSGLSANRIRSMAQELFAESCREMNNKYAPIGK